MKFDAEKETKKIIQFIKEYFQNNHLKGIVIGISGGKDSAVAAAIFTKALGKENVIGVTLPCHSKEEDKIDALKIADFYGFNCINLDLTNTYDTFQKEINKLGNFTEKEKENSDINIKPRLRMTSLYYIAALYTEINHGTYIVSGNGNKCEEFVGYFTKGGDSVSDIKVLSDLTVDEVIKIGEYLNVPKEILYKSPNDGISGKTDEEKLGVTYSDITKYINHEDLSLELAKKIEILHKKNQHKFYIPTYQKQK